jgi:hypothetical protein
LLIHPPHEVGASLREFPVIRLILLAPPQDALGDARIEFVRARFQALAVQRVRLGRGEATFALDVRQLLQLA